MGTDKLEFWGLTKQGSIWRASTELDESGTPCVEKMASASSSPSAENQDMPIRTRLTGGRNIAITKNFGVVLFEACSPRRGIVPPNEANVRLFGGHTSPIVGLFINEADALAALADYTKQLTEWDPLFAKYTMECLMSIVDHPQVWSSVLRRKDDSIVPVVVLADNLPYDFILTG